MMISPGSCVLINYVITGPMSVLRPDLPQSRRNMMTQVSLEEGLDDDVVREMDIKSGREGEKSVWHLRDIWWGNSNPGNQDWVLPWWFKDGTSVPSLLAPHCWGLATGMTNVRPDPGWAEDIRGAASGDQRGRPRGHGPAQAAFVMWALSLWVSPLLTIISQFVPAPVSAPLLLSSTWCH